MTSRPEAPDAAAATPRRVGRPAGATAQGEASRTLIIDAAARVFARLGYDRARMADIVEASGLSKGSVYFHFDSKEDLAVAVLVTRQDRWIADVTALLERQPAGPTRLRALLPAMLSLHADDSDAWVIVRLSQSLADVPGTRGLAASIAQRWIALVAEVILTAQPDAEPEEATLLATVLVGAFDGIKSLTDITAADRSEARAELERAATALERMLLTHLAS